MNMSSSAENFGKKTIDDLPDEILEYILSLISPYKDSDSCKLVSKKWCRIINRVSHHSKCDLYRSVLNCSVLWHSLIPTNLVNSIITKRYSHAACYCDSFMYVFGGCTSRCTTFNDLWTLDLSKRVWLRPFATGSYPSPKACATLCCHNKNLILFGGWTHPPSYPLHQTLKLFNELHIYSISSNKWTIIHSTLSPPPMAGHSATIHGNKMVVFGGLQRGDTMFLYRSANNVWCYNLDTESWNQPETTDPKPKSRYGQSQIYLNDNNILIMGGCQGPNSILDDIWLLTITPSIWVWKQIRVYNSQWAAPHLLCHPACRVENAVVVFSRGTSQTVCHYSLCSIAPSESHMVDASIPPEVVARVTSQGQLPCVKDKNVNGQRGSLGKTAASSSEPSTSSSTSQYENSCATSSQCSPAYSCNEVNDELETHSGKRNVDLQMAAFRDYNTCVKSRGSSKNRMKQLECLKRMEEKYKNPVKEVESKRKVSKNDHSNDPNPGPSGVNNSGNKMNMYVMDISEVLSEKACVTWRPQRCSSNAPKEKMLYSLVLGKGELIMFGGIQTNPTFPVSSYNYVSNSTHIVTAPKNIV